MRIGGQTRALLLTLDSDDFSSPGTGTVLQLPLASGWRALFEPASATGRTLTATWRDTCTGADHFHLRALAIDVVGAR